MGQYTLPRCPLRAAVMLPDMLNIFGGGWQFHMWKVNMTDWMEIARVNINLSAVKKPTKVTRYCLSRKFGHKTRSGKGLVAILREKNRRGGCLIE